MERESECCKRTKVRTNEEKRKIKTRLKIIEGQVRGISGMIDDDRYCDDVLVQISAVQNSLKSLGNQILKSHLSTCVVEDIKNDKLEIIDEIMDLIRKLN